MEKEYECVAMRVCWEQHILTIGSLQHPEPKL